MFTYTCATSIPAMLNKDDYRVLESDMG